MSFEKYGNKLINLLSKMEKKLNPTDAQIGGGDGPETNADENGPYVKILSYSVKHVSILVHLEKDGENKASVLETAQIKYNDVTEYSIEQQLRLGCDNVGQMYKYSIVLTRHPTKEIGASDEEAGDEEAGATGTGDGVSDVGAAFGELSGALEGLAKAVNS
jgi:hypothetical protein